MAEYQYTYSIKTYFSSGFDNKALIKLVNTSTITTVLNSVENDLENIFFNFENQLLASELFILNNIVTNYVYLPVVQYAPILITSLNPTQSAIVLNSTHPNSGVVSQCGSGGFSIVTSGMIFNRAELAVVTTQPNEINLTSPSNFIKLSVQNLLAGILYGNPSVTTILELPTAVSLLSTYPLSINDSLQFSVINTKAELNNNIQNDNDSVYRLVPNTNGSIIGNAIIKSSATFKLKITNVADPSYIVYRLS